MSLRLSLGSIADRYVRDALSLIQTHLNTGSHPTGFKFFTQEFTSAVTEQKIPHGLNFVPLDVIQTSLTGMGELSWEYDLFDRENVYVTTTGPCVVRAYIGTHREDA